jgi:hypothetical protein
MGEELKLETAEAAVKRIGRVGSFAPGSYMCKCVGCGVTFEGDKRALHCLPCAVEGLLAARRPEQEPVAWRYRTKNSAGNWSMWCVTSEKPYSDIYEYEAIPLYATPQASAPQDPVSGFPIDGVDEEIRPLVAALWAAGIGTRASCSGHGHRPGLITLHDGRELVIAPDFDAARKIDALFPLNIHGEATPQAGKVGEAPGLCGSTECLATCDEGRVHAKCPASPAPAAPTDHVPDAGKMVEPAALAVTGEGEEADDADLDAFRAIVHELSGMGHSNGNTMRALTIAKDAVKNHEDFRAALAATGRGEG